MQQFPIPENWASIIENKLVNVATLPASGEQPISTSPHVGHNGSCTTAKQKTSTLTNPFLLPRKNEVVRRVWTCKRDSNYVTEFFDIWQAELAGHFAYRIYEADTLKSLTHSRHPIQAEVLRILVQTELVPSTSSIPFIVRTGSQVDRVLLWEGLEEQPLQSV